MKPELEKVYTEYSRFNAARSLGTATESQFRTARIGGSLAQIDHARPAPGFSNRVLGLAPYDAQLFPDLLALYGDRLPQVDLAPDEIHDDTVDALISSGYRPWISLTYLKTTPTAFPESEMRIESWGHEKADDFFALLNRTVDVPFSKKIWALRRRHYCTDTFRTYVASIKGELCGWATLYIHGCAGVFANAYTFEGFRRRGCHTALLKHRLTEAARLGLTTVFTDVVPGTESVGNCLRAGFEHVSTNTVWLPHYQSGQREF